MKLVSCAVACALLSLSALADEKAPLVSAADKLLTTNLKDAQQKKQFLILHIGAEGVKSEQGALPSLVFNQTFPKWLAQRGRDAKLAFCYIELATVAGAEECCKRLATIAGKEDGQDLFPGIFLFSPDGRVLAFETGAAWGDDTEENVLKFLDRFAAPALKTTEKVPEK
jgi:hypothetical protein